MSCVLLNGSPRGRKSNTRILLESFQEGFGANPPEQLYIYRDTEGTLLGAFRDCDTVIFAFPLYTDLMPGKVKQFIETIDAAEWKGKRVGVVVQSGFPEAVHSSFIARYFRRLAEKREAVFIGDVIRGGVEGMQMMPERMTRKIRTRFRDLGSGFRENGRLDGGVAGKLKRPWRLGPVRRLIFSLLSITGLTNFYWNHHLKANGAFEERFAAPYASTGNRSAE